MPIRFRCVYCDKLLSIGRRKAGVVINCPRCGEKLVVPTPEPEDADASPTDSHSVPVQTTAPSGERARKPATSQRLFEDLDYDELIERSETFRAIGNDEPRPTSKPPRLLSEIERQSPIALDSALSLSDDHRVPSLPTSAAPAHSSGYFLSNKNLILLIVAVGLLLVGAFAGGFFVGNVSRR